MGKVFEIKRFSYLVDEYDDGIVAKEIENMLNKIEEERVGYTKGCAKWEVREINK